MTKNDQKRAKNDQKWLKKDKNWTKLIKNELFFNFTFMVPTTVFYQSL